MTTQTEIGFPDCPLCYGEGGLKSDGEKPTPCPCTVTTWNAENFVETEVKLGLIAARGRPYSRDRIRFWASGAGDLLGVRDAKGEPDGCQRKAYLAFFAARGLIPSIPMDADSFANFAVGDAYHDTMEKLLDRRGVLLGAERPIRTETLSGRLDWLVLHPEYGAIPYDGKSMSSYAFHVATAAKPKDIAQVIWYAGRLGSKAAGLLYYDKESGALKEFVVPFSQEIFDETERVARDLAAKVELDLITGEMTHLPDIPVGIKKPKKKTDRAFPCYWWSSKKKSGGSCAFYEFCHGDAPPHLKESPRAKRSDDPRDAGFTLGGASS